MGFIEKELEENSSRPWSILWYTGMIQALYAEQNDVLPQPIMDKLYDRINLR